MPPGAKIKSAALAYSGVATGGHGGARPPYSAKTTHEIRATPKSFFGGGGGVGSRGCHEIIN